jgi:hypothetical protein
LIDEAYPATNRNSCSKKNDSSPLTPFRRIIPLHIRGVFFNYLETSDVIIDNQNNSFNSKLRDIFMEMRSLFDLENQIIVDKIVAENNSDASIGGASDVSSSSDLTFGRRLFGGEEEKSHHTNIDSEDDENDEEEEEEEEEDNDEEDEDDDDNEEEEDENEQEGGEKENMTKSSSSSSGEEEAEESGMEGGNSTSSNTFSKSLENCKYDIVMFPENCAMREHTIGDLEFNKKYYFNVLR